MLVATHTYSDFTFASVKVFPSSFSNVSRVEFQSAFAGGSANNHILDDITLEGEFSSSKADVLSDSGVPGKGLADAPGLDKEFNENSKAADNAGKK